MSTLEHAVAIAASAHAGQLDKAGQPYLLHALRVMHAVESIEQKVAAVLHDVVEDSAWTLAELRDEGFSPVLIDALDALTHREGEDYAAYILRFKDNAIARSVRCADLRDNSDIGRIPHPTEKDHARLRRYVEAQRVLGCPHAVAE